MTDLEAVSEGTWVEIGAIVLAVGQRAPQVPADTREVALEMRVKGFLLGAARTGDQVDIRTLAGRRLRGTLIAVNPAYEHGFGPPVAALSGIADEARSMLAGRDGTP